MVADRRRERLQGAGGRRDLGMSLWGIVAAVNNFQNEHRLKLTPQPVFVSRYVKEPASPLAEITQINQETGMEYIPFSWW